MSVTTTAVETNNVVDYYTNKDGDLYLKYFLIDSSFNKRGWAVDPSIIEKIAKRSIGAPFTDYQDFPVTRYSDQHPWHPTSSIFKDQYDYAAQKATGFAVDVSPTSSAALKSASGSEIKDGYFVTIKIVDPVKKELYLKNPDRIPKISAGIWDYDELDLVHGKTVVKNADIAHYAGVQKGAYGDKARMYAKCQGGYECVNHLKGASDPETYGETGNQTYSSLGENSTQNKDIMSDQQNPLSTVSQGQENNDLPNQSNNQEQKEQPAQQLLDSQVNNNKATEETQTNKDNKQSNDTNNKAPFRLKTQKFDFQNKPKEESVKVPNWKEDEEYLKLSKEVEELKKERELEKTKAKYAEIIPRELFILNGKFDTIGYNKELTKAVEKNVDPEYATELYKLKLEKLRLSNSKGKPYGASASVASKEYKTPDTVPDSNSNLKGASDINSSQFSGIHNLFKMVGLVKEVSA